MIRLITFDLDNTLWDVDPVLIKAEKKLIAWIETHLPEAQPFYQKDLLLPIRQQLINDNPDIANLPTRLRKAILKHCFREAGLEGTELLEKVDSAFEHFHDARNEIEFFPETLSVLENLNSKFELIALSNGNADIDKAGLGDYFTAHFSAESTGKPKPDPAMFLAALELLNIHPEQAIHIGDHQEEDINAAQRLGFRTIWFNQNGRTVQKTCKPDREVHHLNQLVSAVFDLSD